MPAPTYIPPGVTVTEVLSPQIVPLVTSTSELVIVGLASGIQTRTDRLVVGTLGVPQKLPYLAQVEGSKLHGAQEEYEEKGVKLTRPVLSVFNPYEPSAPGDTNGRGFKYGRDWTISGEEFEALEGGKLVRGTEVAITYEYIPGNYFNAIRLFNVAEAEARFGAAFTEEGKVFSELTLAVTKAFENGARTVIAQPLLKTSGNSPVTYTAKGFINNASTPTSTEAEGKEVWARTLEAANTIEQIDLLVPVLVPSKTPVPSAENVILTPIQGFIANRAAEQQYTIGIYGIDTTLEKTTYESVRKLAADIRGYASGVYAQQNVLINTTNFNVRANQNAEPAVGGQYVAAALAGKLAGTPASTSLTRKVIGGFRLVNDIRNTTEKNLDAQEGLLVVEEIRGGIIRIRHGITVDNEQGVARQELSVVRAKFNVIESVRETLENQIIGRIIADANSPLIVRSAIGAVLTQLEASGQIVSFRMGESKISSLEPTTILAAFSYRPAFTINYIDIKFSLDLSSQTVTVVEEQRV